MAIDLIAFDADDTLWHNETIFVTAQQKFKELLAKYHTEEWIDRKLYETEARNLQHFGYGVKGFTLSMIETAIELSEGRISGTEIRTVVELGKEMLKAPVAGNTSGMVIGRSSPLRMLKSPDWSSPSSVWRFGIFSDDNEDLDD